MPLGFLRCQKADKNQRKGRLGCFKYLDLLIYISGGLHTLLHRWWQFKHFFDFLHYPENWERWSHHHHHHHHHYHHHLLHDLRHLYHHQGPYPHRPKHQKHQKVHNKQQTAGTKNKKEQKKTNKNKKEQKQQNATKKHWEGLELKNKKNKTKKDNSQNNSAPIINIHNVIRCLYSGSFLRHRGNSMHSGKTTCGFCRNMMQPHYIDFTWNR